MSIIKRVRLFFLKHSTRSFIRDKGKLLTLGLIGLFLGFKAWFTGMDLTDQWTFARSEFDMGLADVFLWILTNLIISLVVYSTCFLIAIGLGLVIMRVLQAIFNKVTPQAIKEYLLINNSDEKGL
jgi:hypothetical protein